MDDQAENLRKMMQKDINTDKRKKTRVITVSSGKGGVGKTNIAVNLGIAYAQLGRKVIVMDADLGLANVNICLGIIPKYNLFQLIKRQKTMRDIIIDTNYGIQIVAGASGFS
ncbi:MAG TPA: AAA family ATPase, partial [Spirochaetota bacterium]|nr:AAA family ATPase [Spirochaetota bacterium]